MWRIGAVWVVGRRALHPRRLQQQQVHRERNRQAPGGMRSSARSETAIGDIPGGAARHFWCTSRRSRCPSRRSPARPRPGGHAVRHQQGVASAHRGTERRERMLAAGRGLTVDDGGRRRASGWSSRAPSSRSFGTCSPQSAVSSTTSRRSAGLFRRSAHRSSRWRRRSRSRPAPPGWRGRPPSPMSRSPAGAE